MRHLKRFNESLGEDQLKEFCEVNLAYLLDDPQFSLKVDSVCGKKDGEDYWVYKISLVTDSIHKGAWGSPGFDWKDIEDHYIPFLTHLNNKSKIIGYSKETNNFFDYQSVEIIYQVPHKKEKGYLPYYKIVNIKDLDNLELYNIWQINVYIKDE
jgi:hypothetical protein